MSAEKQSVRIDTRTLLYGELKQSGGDPSTLFEILEGIIARRDWEKLLDESGQPIGSFRRFLEAPLPVGCGVKAEKILALLHVEHRYETDKDYSERMAHLRDQVSLLLISDKSPLIDEGLKNGTGKAELDRLRRDHPELIQRIRNQDISPNSAAGARKSRVVIPSNDMELAVKALEHNLTHEQLIEMIGILFRHLESVTSQIENDK